MQKLPTIGIIGGGQLGKMFIENASKMAIPITILDKDKNCPAHPIAKKHIVGSITDADAIQQLADSCDVLTWEIEHIHVDKLIDLQQQGKTIIPNPHVLKIIQDKGKQKQFYQDNNIPTSPFFNVKNRIEAIEKLKQSSFKKVAIKSCTGGYDGKGVFIAMVNDILENQTHIPFDGELMIEEFVECKKELAVLVARDQHGNNAVYPCIEMEFTDSNLVSFLISPANIEQHIEQQAQQIALQCADAFNSAGLFAVEFFLSLKDELCVNEIAPRPHNSAHHTIEGFYASQYEQLLRILLDKPLASTAMLQPCAMVNIVGDKIGKYQLKYMKELMQLEGVYIHLYGKEESKPNRKLGHVTIVNEDRNKVIQLAEKVRTLTAIELID
ncbi:MAG TPA: 5-(carboxyamino)imidazole ribonucleotide synthase [Chitinophagales bacterium]|jgi:5-(carboxyamino)imidazole ribonucleotide synthase|nr:5-(carboxyamino)imidazole ribonucleotide synthase [Chitinophagales bacterium]HQV76856.1 5-(carboxyamino)imidazole ribonucleotide synthase [Chitinophagales bacterium]HQW78077.1 5-(carboxyamino)imidazole ribonucleotide synthase [Chitinophagales bacterium]HRB67828.1 5-(carboxyamino)imidazole ribonucleotide synthase [Chitinophagales bacterium]HRB69340.1 5-(carboxyamino)imidazole ribonucleotide synthase [Chitinophagales bacterium]